MTPPASSRLTSISRHIRGPGEEIPIAFSAASLTAKQVAATREGRADLRHIFDLGGGVPVLQEAVATGVDESGDACLVEHVRADPDDAHDPHPSERRGRAEGRVSTPRAGRPDGRQLPRDR